MSLAHTRRFALLPVLVCLLAGNGFAVASVAATLPVGETTYLGQRSDDGLVEYFLGIPFAQSPAGERRWKAPQALAPKTGKVEAMAFAPGCAQGPHIVNWYRGVVTSFGGDPDVVSRPDFSEDCLYLNIWRPVQANLADKSQAGAKTDSQGLPVMVFIHGGSNKGGWSYEPNYVGENLSRRGVVVVTIAYRLGVFGFFAHPELADANFGLLDQVAALEWIRDNIAAAGGDPANVTVMGESAGANDITHLLVSPLADGLFQRVIHQSAGWAISGRTTHEAHLGRGAELHKRLLKDGGGIEQLRAVPAEQVLQAADIVYEGYSFDPVIDGRSLIRPVRDVLLEGTFPAVDLLAGTNAHEWLMYLDDEQTIDDWLTQNLQEPQIAAAKSALGEKGDSREKQDRLITAYNFVCPTMYLAQRVRDRGGRSWLYYFSRQREGEQAARMGAYHGAELPYVFDTHDDWLPTNDLDRRLTDTIMSYWVNFARSGEPNAKQLTTWPLFDRLSARVLRLDTQINSQVHESLALCDVLLPPA